MGPLFKPFPWLTPYLGFFIPFFLLLLLTYYFPLGTVLVGPYLGFSHLGSFSYNFDGRYLQLTFLDWIWVREVSFGDFWPEFPWVPLVRFSPPREGIFSRFFRGFFCFIASRSFPFLPSWALLKDFSPRVFLFLLMPAFGGAL